MEQAMVDYVYVESIMMKAQHYAAFGFDDKDHKYFYINALEVLYKTKLIGEKEYTYILSKVNKGIKENEIDKCS